MIGLLSALPLAGKAFSFFMGPTGRALGLVLAVTLAAGFVYHKGHASAQRKCDAATVRARVAILEADLKAQTAAATAARALAIAARQKVAEHEGLINELEIKATANPDTCRTTGDDARRLRGIK